MCLAIPARITQCSGSDAVADLHGNQVRVSTILVPEASIGDWVLIHAGFAIQRLNPEEVQQTWAVLEDLDKCLEGSR